MVGAVTLPRDIHRLHQLLQHYVCLKHGPRAAAAGGGGGRERLPLLYILPYLPGRARICTTRARWSETWCRGCTQQHRRARPLFLSHIRK